MTPFPPAPARPETGWRVDPFAITRFDRSDAELEALFVFCCCVAGKKATMISAMVEDFLGGCGHTGTPFARIRAMVAEGSLEANLRRARLGKYSLLGRCLSQAASREDIDLRTSPPETLETLPGVGPKTARFFVLHSRAGARVAVIDTHMLKYLRAAGADRVPSGVPTGKVYARLEQAVLAASEASGLSFADFDLGVWSWYASGGQGMPVLAPAGVSAVSP